MALRYTNTEFERLALANVINLSDGHARQTLSSKQRAIFASTDQYLEELHGRTQDDIESEFIELFLSCARQESSWDIRRQYLNYSASSALSLAALLCRQRGRRALLIEPCFDNIRHLLLAHQVEVEAISEETLTNPAELREKLGPDVMLWIVQPNNPTGFCLDEQTFNQLADVLEESGAGLVVDFTFRFFAPSLYEWRQYDLFDRTGIDYIAIEDTGKTWAAADLKVGMTVCSQSLAPMVHELHDQLLLNVSPLTLMILIEFLRDSELQGVASAVRSEVDRNRATVRRLVDDNLVALASQMCGNVPLELLELPPTLDAMDFWKSLRSRRVDILPASNYYWTSPFRGRNQFRIPLSRPRFVIDEAVSIIAKELRKSP